MTFEHISYLPIILVILGSFIGLTVYLEKKFFFMVKTYWFYNRSIFSYFSTLFFISGLGLLLFSLLDARGPEERIKASVGSTKTIILLDTSASMLAEDVKPSRLQKAVLIAKHFARKAAGHQLSVVAFAEIQKKIVPFTNDLDLIDARLDSLKALRNQNGSSALSLAIQESIQYFKEAGQERGNILVLTDGEETAGGIDIQVSKDYHIALVGVGTEQGGRIPLDDSRGFRFGYKKSEGRDVITKFNENFFKRLVADLPSAKFWTSSTYSLPSEEILDFFKTEVKKGEGEQDMVMKPVMMEWIVLPALLLIIISYFLKAIRMFSLGLLLIITPVQAQEEKPEIKIPPEVIARMDKLQKGELSQIERLKLADDLLRAGAKDESAALYEENLPMNQIDPNLPKEAYLNYGTALLEKGDGQKGMSVYDSLASSLDTQSDKSKNMKELMEKNVTKFFQQQEEQEQKKKEEEEKNKKEGDNKDKKEQEGQGKKDGEGQSGEQKEKGKGDEEKKDENGKSEDQKDQDKKDGEEGDKDKKDQQGENSESNKRPPLQKMTPKLKQLMSDDRQLQMRMIESGTRELNKRSKSRKNKDW